jgi:hypothetical protein
VREPRYPEGAFRADFWLGDTFVEYLGLAGQPTYDEKTEEKKRICKRHGIALICVAPADLLNQPKLLRRLSKAARTRRPPKEPSA